LDLSTADLLSSFYTTNQHHEGQNMKKYVLYSLVITGLLMNTACDSDELAAGAVGVGIGIGIGDHYDRHHDRNHRRGRDGRWDGRRNRLGVVPEDMDMDLTKVSSTEAFAQTHHISTAAAKKIETAFNGIDNQGLAAFDAIGLDQQDVKVLATKSMPKQSSINSMAAHLGISSEEARTLLGEVNQEFAKAASDVHSDYWQACMADGYWKTPQNSSCRNAAWSGCSPETGAEVCY
jgi:hypothetical protein